MHNGKAGNLGILAKIRGINVPPFIALHYGMSEIKQSEAIRSFLKAHDGGRVAVRSSAEQEDSLGASFAGMYATKLHVEPTEQAIRVAVDEVRCSGRDKKEVVAHYVEQRGLSGVVGPGISVILQKMIEADMSGVIFSHDPAKSDGYYAVSVSSGVGEKIVGGNTNGRLIRIARGVKSTSIREEWLRELIVAMRAIERRFKSLSLDVEFAVQHDVLYILQCRPITTAKVGNNKAQEKRFLQRITSMNEMIASHYSGDVLGDMIDVNPVELLGVAPTPLDISIFKRLFADNIVEQVRREMGYDPLDIGILRVIEGKPYVSMRASAFSFRPRGISDEIYERMVDVYRNMLTNNPALQSRVEFDVFAMEPGEKLERVLEEACLEDDEKIVVREAFRRIERVFSQVSVTYSQSFDAFAARYEECTVSLRDASLDDVLAHVACGTEMFVRVARLAFYWKNRFEEMHPQDDLNVLMRGHICSMSERLQSDLVACRSGAMTREEIIERYGHLRPGQFSVFGESYADDPSAYLFAQMQRAEVAQYQRQAHAFVGAPEFMYVVTFMEARERMKFLFSQSLHLFATKLKKQLADRGISEHDASRVSWDELCMLDDTTHVRTEEIEHDSSILMPDVIIPSLTDLGVITFSEAMPSYITDVVVKARVCVLERVGMKADVRGAIVLLPNADPGYDFLFHSGAVGIVTKVGGPASHMCIRSIELQMPACIGCGENVYQQLLMAHSAILDCSKRQIVVLD